MPRCEVDMYARWWTTDNIQSVAVWKMVHMCLLWCLGKKMNNRSFVDCERTFGKIMSFLFKTLYLGTIAYVSPLTISYSDFLVLFAHSS
jgi:hypothetical protein